MDLLEEVQSALQPMIDRGIVVYVRESRGIPPPIPEGVPVPPTFFAYVGDEDPKDHVAEVIQLIYAAGLMGRVKVDMQSGQGPTI
jgi:hypothetical protein